MALKSCPCGKKLGPNTRTCPNCGHDFVRQILGFASDDEYEENGGVQVISNCKCGDKETCSLCEEEYEINNYYKCGNNFYYYNATGKFCRLTCLLKSDLDKTKIILSLLKKFPNEGLLEIEDLKKEYSTSLIESLFKDPKEQYKEISYRRKIPDFDTKEDRQLRMFNFKKKNNLELTEEEKEFENQQNVDEETKEDKPVSFLDFVKNK